VCILFTTVQDGCLNDSFVYSHFGCNRNAMIDLQTLAKPSKYNIGFTDIAVDIVNAGDGPKAHYPCSRIIKFCRPP